MIKSVEALRVKRQITFSEWKMVSNKQSNRIREISQIVVTISSFRGFNKHFVKELHTLQQQLFRVHSLCKAFKGIVR